MLEKLKNNDVSIGVIGLGYVGLPLAVEFGKQFNVVGFDVNQQRIKSLRQGNDETLEVTEAELAEAINLRYAFDVDDLKS